MIVALCAWMGAVLMCAAPFFIDTDGGKITAVIGLTLLTVQAYDGRLYHLIALNIISAGGFLYALYF
jgi:hypothetical protein